MDRKRINKWARWFAIMLAITFAFGTVFLGVGSSTGDIFSGCDKSSPDSISSSSSIEDREAYYKAQIEQNPLDTDSMMALANLYAATDVGRYDDAIVYYTKALEVAPNNPNNAATYALIGNVNMSKGDYEAAVKAYTLATQAAPTEAYNYVQLGTAARNAGQNQTAILAWSKYLEMNPNYSNAEDLKKEIARLSTLPAVSTPQTTSVPGSPGTTAPVTPSPPPTTP
ncbi:MAG: tetratricopeptide repeat protein [Actinobacteria bacterium]|nr:tetratricopeptide repeat protein [Actinomycetota bacterium]